MQRLCSQCKAVALKGKHLCKRHSQMRTQARNQRSVAIRMQRFLPENRCLVGVIETPLLEDAAAIALSADSITRALRHGRIDTARAGMFLYTLQIAHTNLK